jgi:hypothetical protein
MPRYFFTIRRQDRFENGPDSAYLPDAEAALSYADYTIGELRKKSGYEDDLSLMMIVKDQAGQTVLSLLFFPGCQKHTQIPRSRPFSSFPHKADLV